MLITAVALALMLGEATASAEDPAMLGELHSFAVEGSGFDEATADFGLWRSVVVKQVEAALRRNGIATAGPKREAAPGNPGTLAIGIVVVPRSESTATVGFSLEARRQSGPDGVALPTAWQSTGFVTGGGVAGDKLRDALEPMLEHFCADYVAARRRFLAERAHGR